MIQKNAAATEAAAVAEGLAAQAQQLRGVPSGFSTDAARTAPARRAAAVAARRRGAEGALPRPAGTPATPGPAPGTPVRPKTAAGVSGQGAADGVARDLGREDMTDADLTRS